MTNLIIEISKYFMIFMFAFYTYECFGYQYADFLCGAGGTSGDDTDLLSIVLQQIIETFDEQSVHAFDDRVYHADKAFF